MITPPYALSYVIQNFYIVNPNINLNQKLYLIWLSRNIHVLITYLLKGFNAALFLVNSTTKLALIQNLFSLFYSKALFKLVKDVTKRWKSFLTLNVNKSLQHFVLTQGIAFVDDEMRSLATTPIQLNTSHLFLNQYFTNKSISNINLHNKHYRATLLKLLTSLQGNWTLWNKHYKTTYGFILITSKYYNFTYYNHYFFKVYNF